jgi:LAS superfamily LD-carboxypeptidase LdcB
MLRVMRAVLVLALLCSSISFARAEDEPRSVTGYRNGRPFKLKVVEVGWADVEVKTAAAFLKMQAAALKDGISLVVYSGFRTYERQAELYEYYRRGEGNLAAKPGHSNHQSGRALDLMIDSEGVYAWLNKHARRYGFLRTVKGEPWHWEFVGVPRRGR